MAKFILRYSVVVEVEDENYAELLSVDLEDEIKFLNKRIINVDCDPYVEELR